MRFETVQILFLSEVFGLLLSRHFATMATIDILTTCPLYFGWNPKGYGKQTSLHTLSDMLYVRKTFSQCF